MNVLDILFLAILGIGIVANFLSIPGNFIILFDSFWYGLVNGYDRFSTAFLLTLLIVALAIEFLEYLIIAFGARRFGASKLGCVAAVVGGIIGSISGFCFSPVMGAIVGGFLGVIIGTFGIEILRGKNVRESFHATLGAILGRVGGLTVKVIGTMAMAVMVLTHLTW